MTNLVELKSQVGRSLIRDDIVAPGPARAALATLGRTDWEPKLGDPLPPAWHMFYCVPTDPPVALGSDGLPRSYEVIPELPLPRRMFAGARMRFKAPIHIGDCIRLESELKSVSGKRGSTGELIFATVINRVFRDGNELAVEEEYDIVAREAVLEGGANPMPITERVPGNAAWRDSVVVDAVMLFRFSALVFNPHRIHYDRAHAIGVEGYPGLVVHGPLHLILLLEFLHRQEPERVLASLTMRAKGPLFDNAPIGLTGHPAADDHSVELWTTGPDSRIATEVAVAFAETAL